jgi:putative transcriptional regulator
MSRKVVKDLLASVDEAIAHANGDASKARVRRGSKDIDVAYIRAKMKLSQPAFADLCGVSVGTLRNWEQKRRDPTGPARALLLLVQQAPMSALLLSQRDRRAA